MLESEADARRASEENVADKRWHKVYLGVVLYTALIILLLSLFSRYFSA